MHFEIQPTTGLPAGSGPSRLIVTVTYWPGAKGASRAAATSSGIGFSDFALLFSQPCRGGASILAYMEQGGSLRGDL